MHEWFIEDKTLRTDSKNIIFLESYYIQKNSVLERLYQAETQGFSSY